MAFKFSIPKIFRKKGNQKAEITEVDANLSSSEIISSDVKSENVDDSNIPNPEISTEDVSSADFQNSGSENLSDFENEVNSNNGTVNENTDKLAKQEKSNEEKKTKITFLKSKWFKILVVLFLLFFALCALGASTYYTFRKEQIKKEKAAKKVSIDVDMPKKHIEPIDRSNFKTLKLDDYGTVNPFNPDHLIDVPKTGLQGDKSYLTPPPSGDMVEPEASSVMSTTISGILYDGLNSSAIINIEGVEYFVKQNDSVNNYNILSITPNQVKIKYGNNIYKAGVGELLTKVESNSNIVNLNRKFGGNSLDGVAIKVRKK